MAICISYVRMVQLENQLMKNNDNDSKDLIAIISELRRTRTVLAGKARKKIMKVKVEL